MLELLNSTLTYPLLPDSFDDQVCLPSPCSDSCVREARSVTTRALPTPGQTPKEASGPHHPSHPPSCTS